MPATLTSAAEHDALRVPSRVEARGDRVRIYDLEVGAGSADESKAGLWIGSVVIRCRRFEEMLRFWQAALGYVQREPPEKGWVVLTDPTGRGANVSLDRVEQVPPLGDTSRVHLDFYTDDLVREVERLLGLGASRYDREARPEDDFVVLVDPGR